MEVNGSLENLVRFLAGSKARQWDVVLTHIEFSYNKSVNMSTYQAPFEIVCGKIPKGVIFIGLVAEKRCKDGKVIAKK